LFFVAAASGAAIVACNSLSGIDSLDTTGGDAGTSLPDATGTGGGDGSSDLTTGTEAEASTPGTDGNAGADALSDGMYGQSETSADSPADAYEGGTGDAGALQDAADATAGDASDASHGDATAEAGSDAVAEGATGDGSTEATTSDASADAPGEAGDASSPCPAGMVRVTSPSPNPSYCVDAYEVTNGDYASFVAANPPVSSQPSYCSWNTSFTPSSAWPATTVPNQPVAFVDWCDAQAYCAWAGKRLCGAIGGGAAVVASGSNASVDQWYNACSLGGTLTYVYGTAWHTAYCNDYWTSYAAVVDVGYLTNCVGGFAGIHDMTGNVWEWEDACTASAGAADQCNMRGGGFDTKNSNTEQCNNWTGNARNASAANLGFRCCRD
jgi:hypothetical protein